MQSPTRCEPLSPTSIEPATPVLNSSFITDKVISIDSIFIAARPQASEDEYNALVKQARRLQKNIRVVKELYKDLLAVYKNDIEVELQKLRYVSTEVQHCRSSVEIDEVIDKAKRDYLDFVAEESVLTFTFSINQTKLFQRARNQVLALDAICHRIIELRPEEYPIWDAAVHGSKWYLIG